MAHGAWRMAHGVCMRSNLILFVLVFVNQNFIGPRDEYEDEDEDDDEDDDDDDDEDDDEGGSCRAVSQRAKATHLTSVICSLLLVP